MNRRIGVLGKFTRPPSSESPLKHESAYYFSIANYTINLDSCGEYSLRTWLPLAIEKRRNLGGFLTPLRNLQMRAAFIAPFISEE